MISGKEVSLWSENRKPGSKWSAVVHMVPGALVPNQTSNSSPEIEEVGFVETSTKIS